MEVPPFISRQVDQGDYFFVDLLPDPSVPLAVACGGREICSLSYTVDRKRFLFHGIEFVLAGEGELRLAAGRFALRPGSVFTYGPRTKHHIRSIGKTQLVKCFVDFTGKQCGQLLRSGGLVPGDCVQLGRIHWVEQIFNQLLSSGKERKKFASRHCRILLEAMVSRLAIDAQPMLQPGASSMSSATSSRQTFERCRDFVDAHYMEIRTIRQAASACEVGPAYFSRLFERFAGETPYQRLTRRKMNAAAEMLWHQQASVKQVAVALHYEDVFHFSRVFKRVYGIPPSHFRGAAQLRDNTSN
jgi:AraC-like DNA-binding protein